MAAAAGGTAAQLLVDAYHALNVVPFSLAGEGLDDAFVVGGGYKYCQLGEGNCFLRIPPDSELRPVVTGWFSEFTALAERQVPGRCLRRGRRPLRRGDLRSHQPLPRRGGVRVLPGAGAHAGLLREVSQHQIGLLAAAFDALDLDPGRSRRDRDGPAGGVGGFLALRSPPRRALVRGAPRARRMTDARGDVLRLGPAPYLSDRQLGTRSASWVRSRPRERAATYDSGKNTTEARMSQREHDRRIDYIEFAVADVEAAKRFYGTVFGWKSTDYGPDYASFEDGRLTGGFSGGGAAKPGGPLVVIYATDLEAVLGAVKAAGGRITQPTYEFLAGGNFISRIQPATGLAVWSDPCEPGVTARGTARLLMVLAVAVVVMPDPAGARRRGAVR